MHGKKTEGWGQGQGKCKRQLSCARTAHACNRKYFKVETIAELRDPDSAFVVKHARVRYLVDKDQS